MEAQNVYLGSENVLDLYLASDGAALTGIQMASITRIRIAFGDKTIYSDNNAGEPIRWNQGGYRDGEFRLTLGFEQITPGYYEAAVAVHHGGAPRGVTWARVPIQVWPEPENDIIVRATCGRLRVVGYNATIS